MKTPTKKALAAAAAVAAALAAVGYATTRKRAPESGAQPLIAAAMHFAAANGRPFKNEQAALMALTSLPVHRQSTTVWYALQSMFDKDERTRLRNPVFSGIPRKILEAPFRPLLEQTVEAEVKGPPGQGGQGLLPRGMKVKDTFGNKHLAHVVDQSVITPEVEREAKRIYDALQEKGQPHELDLIERHGSGILSSIGKHPKRNAAIAAIAALSALAAYGGYLNYRDPQQGPAGKKKPERPPPPKRKYVPRGNRPDEGDFEPYDELEQLSGPTPKAKQFSAKKQGSVFKVLNGVAEEQARKKRDEEEGKLRTTASSARNGPQTEAFLRQVLTKVASKQSQRPKSN